MTLMNDIYPDYGYGPRLDGTNKGPGFARIDLPDGSIMTEFSLGPPDQLYPAVYQGISHPELLTLKNVFMYGWDPMQYQVYDNAYNAYLSRVSQGLPAFYSPAYDGPPGGYVDRGPVSR